MNFDLEEYREHWNLDPTVHHINHGSFGAVPTIVRNEQARWSDHIQNNPVQFFMREAMPAVQLARGKVAKFLGQRPDQIALVRNTTEGASTTMRGFPFKLGDEAVVLDHEYGAVTYSVERAVIAAGGSLVEVKIPRLASDGEVLRLVESAFTAKTRMFVVDHVTSATARTFPVQELSDLCRAKGIAIVIDASHVPGNIDLDLDKLDADFWFGNLHKWCSAPLGTGVFRIADRWKDVIRPLIVSWQDHESYPMQWDMLGTVDLSGWLATPTAIDFYANIGWERARKANIARMRYGRDLVMKELGISSDQLREEEIPLGVVPLLKMSGGREGCFALQEKIATEYKIEVPITTYSDSEQYFMRISGQLYNIASDYEALIPMIRKELK
ncbi:MAG: aminotransferase class V-fold PLP-dependent enzyme [Actinomycetes bacterium]|tara:strand:+ start:3541 stop:4692 length:1152 start_codon:yes stop_codon:yes gene_type:complete